MQIFKSFTDTGHGLLELPRVYNERHYVKVPDNKGKTCDQPFPPRLVGFVEAHSLPASASSEGKDRTILPFTEKRWKSKSDKDSFTAIRKSGVVKFTPWSAGNQTVTKHVVELNPIYTNIVIGSEVTTSGFEQDAKCRVGQSGPTTYLWHTKQMLQKRVHRTSIDYIREDFGDIPMYALEPDGDRDSLANAAKASVVSDLGSSYDLLTEIGEFSETAKTIIDLIEKAKRPTELFKALMTKKRWTQGTRMSKDLSSAWLQYRYAIMPIYYSIMDLIETFSEARSVYKTARRKETITFAPSIRDMTRTHLFEDGESRTLISAVGKVGFKSVASRLLNQIRFNPLATAWELTKFSWVVDWFINVGDWITAQSSTYGVDLGQKYCISFTDEFVINTSLYIPPMDSEAKVIQKLSPKNYRTKPTFQPVINNSGGQFLLQTVSGRTYTRSLFTPTDIFLDFNPQLTWKRGLDALSLAVGRTSFRRFK